MSIVTETFASDVFHETVMRQTLPSDVFAALMRTRQGLQPLDASIAQPVADAMRAWAVEKGATHYTHWFQPLNGVTAEKHDSFLTCGPDRRPLESFSGKNLICGESDASSFPSGSLRATFEARGYTIWDPTCDAFVKDGSLYIPTAFCSYAGHALDEKTPLLRAMQALRKAGGRALAQIGSEDATVIPTVGPEQEYFLIDRQGGADRLDITLCGRTLFGAKPPKGQELSDHYYGHISQRIRAFMADLDESLWRLGVYAQTKHNEAAPAQHELAVLYAPANIAADHNQLVMEQLVAVAERHGMRCLLHPKPFANVNGSGKHNNFSLSTSAGRNLLKLRRKGMDQTLFLAFLCAVIRAVDRHADLLRVACASAANDHRLGGHEAPPPILSIYLGEELTALLGAVARGEKVADVRPAVHNTNLDALPDLTADTSDRNRTSPVAFTGDKFEFRMLGSMSSISFLNTVLCTAVAESLDELAEHMQGDAEKGCHAFITKVWNENQRVLFDGNNYTQDWVDEAKRRGLPALATTPDAIDILVTPENIAFFAGVLSEPELGARAAVMRDSYNRILRMESRTLVDMVRKDILPAAQAHVQHLCALGQAKSNAGVRISAAERQALSVADQRMQALMAAAADVEKKIDDRPREDKAAQARYCAARVLPAMDQLRAIIDELEKHVPSSLWNLPTYTDLLYE